MENENLIAVIGMSGRFPQAETIDDLWRNLLSGKECIQHFTKEELKESGIPLKELEEEGYVMAKGVIGSPNAFDTAFFDYTAREALIMDPQARVFLEETWKAIEDSGNAISRFKGRVSVYAGSGMNTYILRALQKDLVQQYDDFDIMMGSDKDLLSTRVSYKLNLTGPSISVQSTCSTSLVAVHLACQGLLSGDCDMAVAGGVSVSYPLKQGYKYRKGTIFSETGHCRPFEAHSDGTIFSDGVGVVILKRLEDALRDKDDIYGVIRGIAVNNDGSNKVSFTAPSPVGQAQVIRDCLALANVPVETIQYVEAHGSGTEIGDLLEIKAISQVYGELSTKRNFCALGSIKSNLGHLNTASGIAGLIKALLILKHKTIPPMANFNQENEQLNLKDSQFYINCQPVSLRTAETARVAVSSFGIGGTNAHAIIEEAPMKKEVSEIKGKSYIFPFSAKTQVSLFLTINKFISCLEDMEDSSLGRIAGTLQTGREFFGIRKAVVSADKEDLIIKLRNVLKTKNAVKSSRKQVYFLVTGQGSQYVNMAKGLYESIGMFKEIVDKGIELIKKKYHENLFEILYPKEKDDTYCNTLMNDTQHSQPLLFLVSYAFGRYLMSLGIWPDKIVGHSLGEYVGACLAGVMSFENGLDIVYHRGKYLQSAQRGKMLAVKVSLESIKEFKLKDVYISVVNAPESIVIGGSFEAIAEAEKILASHDIIFQPLHTSHAFHTPMMQEAAEHFGEYLQKFTLKDPDISLISNVTGQEVKAGQLCNSSYWKEHIVNPVLFSKSIEHLLEGEEAVFVEIGSGRALIELAKQQRNSKNHVFIDMLPGRYYRQSQYNFFLEKLAILWELNIPVDFESFLETDYYKLHLPAYCFDRQEFSLLELKQNVPDKTEEIYKEKISFHVDLNRDGITTQYMEPQDEVEELLLKLLKENTGMGNIGVLDNFFELGLSSLSAGHYAMLIKESIDLDIEIRSIIESGCVAKLAEIVASELLLVSE
ncbi:MAG: acyltransferase domain-containing protein [Hungatella sp.]|nr:acyltransferase domain-containing protein [Hungatella sp.]